MSLPPLPPQGSPDPALAWAALTTRVAWNLYRARVRATPEILAEAREHVLLSAPEARDARTLEIAADLHVEEYLERTMAGRYRGPRVPEPLPPVDPAWRRLVEAACDATVLAVFRLRYGDGLPPAEVMTACNLDPSTWQAVVEGLAEVVREEAQARGISHIPPGPAWAEALLERVASAAGDDCPDAATWVRAASAPAPLAARDRDHIGGCPRCARAIRLLRAGLMAPGDLDLPDPFPPVSGQAQVLALHLHPQGRVHRRSLVEALGACARPVGEDSILVDIGRGDGWREGLLQRVRMGLPPRDHLRGAVARGAGRWTRRAVLGPVPLRALEASRARTWGEVEGIALLPDPLPPPPSVMRIWTGAILVGLVAALAGTWLVLGGSDDARWPLEASVHAGGGAVILRFDVDDRAVVDAYEWTSHGVQAVLVSASSADKAALATGDGDYEVVTFGRGAVAISSAEPLPDLLDVVSTLALPGADVAAVEARIRALRPDADVAVALPPIAR